MAVKRTRPANKTMINFINKILTKIFGSSGDPVSYTHLTLPTKA